MGVENVDPPSADWRNHRSEPCPETGLCPQAISTKAPWSTNCGPETEEPFGATATFTGAENVLPPSVESLNTIFAPDAQASPIPPLERTAIWGFEPSKILLGAVKFPFCPTERTNRTTCEPLTSKSCQAMFTLSAGSTTNGTAPHESSPRGKTCTGCAPLNELRKYN